MKTRGDSFNLIGKTDEILGAAVKTAPDAKNPIYVSVGHRISLDTAVALVVNCSKFRNPEPVRLVSFINLNYQVAVVKTSVCM